MEGKTIVLAVIIVVIVSVVVVLVSGGTPRATLKKFESAPISPVIWASGADKMLYRLTPTGWQLSGPCCVTNIAYNPIDKRIYGVTEKGLIQSMVPSPASSWFRAFYDNNNYDAKSIAFDSYGVPWHVSPNTHKIYSKDPGGVFSGWKENPDSCCVDYMTFNPSGGILGMSSEGKVYALTSEGSKVSWSEIKAMSLPGVKSLTYSPATKTYYTISSRGQILTMPASGGSWMPFAPESPVPLTSVAVVY